MCFYTPKYHLPANLAGSTTCILCLHAPLLLKSVSIELSKCKQILEELVKLSSSIYLVIDGLDELPNSERSTFLPILSRFIKDKAYTPVLKVFVASQKLNDIEKVLRRSRNLKTITVGSGNRKDIGQYIRFISQDIVDYVLEEDDPSLEDKIANCLETRADGM